MVKLIKFKLEQTTTQLLNIPLWSTIRHVNQDTDGAYLWVEVGCDTVTTEQRRIEQYRDDVEIPDGDRDYIGALSYMDNGYCLGVLFVYENFAV